MKERISESIKKFLLEYSEILFIVRDGSNAYSGAVKKYLTEITEIADRFHLIKNYVVEVENYLNLSFLPLFVLKTES